MGGWTALIEVLKRPTEGDAWMEFVFFLGPLWLRIRVFLRVLLIPPIALASEYTPTDRCLLAQLLSPLVSPSTAQVGRFCVVFSNTRVSLFCLIFLNFFVLDFLFKSPTGTVIMPGVYLFSSEGNSNPIYLDDEAAKLSGAIQEYRQSFLSNFIRLEYEHATKEALSLVADFCKTHAADVDVSEWTSNLKNLDMTELLDIMQAAKYLQIEGLMGFCNRAGRGPNLPDEFFEIKKEDDDHANILMARKREEDMRKMTEYWQRKEQEVLMKLQMDNQKRLQEEEDEMRSLDEFLQAWPLTFLVDTEDQEEEDQEEHGILEESTDDQEEHGIVEESTEEHGIVEESTEDQEEHGIVEESTEDQEEEGIVEESTEDQEEEGNEDSG
ncbi:hypothetical protein CKAN_01486900 [Cinnamomum micranthum f. kanehirae]|uniref:Uncharacterized protein n=1 Tax=Cinnamomum micranthum f. kanehirae TaxID=337451 RepID=A0A3S3QKR6_9MAGN|nr:hypothetical protein CKAN_01486900 [Cinnamomum micranthum f. kanehirae]